MAVSIKIMGILLGNAMVYTVKKLSLLSGVTVRTLHFYEEIGLLKPAYHGANGYRYYEEKELLHLQQILFFKELGLTLKKIQKIVGMGDFDQLAALYSHKAALTQEKEKIGNLIETIDKTIQHLTGKKKMKDNEIFDGFTTITVDPKNAAESLVLKNLETTPGKDQKKIQAEMRVFYHKMVSCIEEGLSPASDRVQELILEHYSYSKAFYKMSPEVYQALAELYRKHPSFRKQLDAFHPKLADFMSDAMLHFAE